MSALEESLAREAGLARSVAAVGRLPAVDRILQIVGRLTGQGFSAVARVTDGRWIACAVRDEIGFGLRVGGELKLETTICNEVRGHGQVVAIDHVAVDGQYCNHPTPRMYGFQSYISVPIVLPDGTFFGTLCAIDPKPARVNTPEMIGTLTLFAELIAMHLDSHERLQSSETALLDARAAAQLREQFIAVLGHDLRNPVAAIQMATEMLQRSPHSDRDKGLLTMMKSSVGRIAGLINDLLDFARGRLGGGLALTLVPDAPVGRALEQVIDEVQQAKPNVTIRREIAIDRPVAGDAGRVGQMLSNLVSNAVHHGDPTRPITVVARTSHDAFEMSVENEGKTIPPAVMATLFEPFTRGSATPGQEGLGLGLYIATEIARAHDGSLGVESVDGTTRFTFRMPLRG